MRLVANEQSKLTATYINGVAIAFAALGGIAPWIPVLGQGSWAEVTRLLPISLVCFLLSVGLHYVALKFLRRLRES